MKSYKEIIHDDTFKIDDNYFIDTKVVKMCWGCETKHKSGYMVWDATKLRRIFLCKECFARLGD
ncbi:MAG: hypothetical protein ACFFBC_13185 [Promethearchaeota archaeon]